jgi:hypothetical protein
MAEATRFLDRQVLRIAPPDEPLTVRFYAPDAM